MQDILIGDNILGATYADDTAILLSPNDPTNVSYKLQIHFNKVSFWLNFEMNVEKSTHVTVKLE